MKFLVTGGAGFIGSNFVNLMSREHPEDDYLVYDALTYCGNLFSIEAALGRKNVSFLRGDISDEAAVDALFGRERFDYVVNFAAETHVDRSIKDPKAFLRSNVEGTLTLLEAARKHGLKRFHQVSTDEVYGMLPLEDKDLAFTEESPLAPSSPYSASKAAADLYVLAYHRTYGLNVTISRCSNNYGPYQFPEKLIPLVLTRALKDERIPVYGNGKNVRDWLYVEDHCRAIDLIVRKGDDGEIYNVGGHGEKENIEVVKLILETLGKPLSLIAYVKDRPGHDLRYAINPTKVSSLGFAPTHRPEEGIKKTIEWYLSHRDWLRKVEDGSYLAYVKEQYGE